MTIAGATTGQAPLSPLEAWRNVLVVTLLGCLLLGLGNAVFLAQYLAARMTMFDAAVWLEVGLSAAFAVILVILVFWQRAQGSSLVALGWDRAPTTLSVVCALALAAAWLGMSWMGVRQLVPTADPGEFHWIRLALAPLGIFMALVEETMMRGFFMNQLNRAGVSTWLQILASGVCTALFHALQSASVQAFAQTFIFSTILFSLLAGLYVLGKRSLYPNLIAHGLTEALGEPYLLMMVLAPMVAA
jgi:membrane protease YdiL (CAAX protease family)